MPTLAPLHKTPRAKSWLRKCPRCTSSWARVSRETSRGSSKVAKGKRPAGTGRVRGQQPGTDCAPQAGPSSPSQDAARYWWK